MKTLIVREAFSLGANFYDRGAEITDPAIITMAKESHPGHVLESQDDVAATVPQEAPAEEVVEPEVLVQDPPLHHRNRNRGDK